MLMHTLRCTTHYFSQVSLDVLFPCPLARAACFVRGLRSRKVVWVEGQKGWGCSECAWVFHPSGPPTGESLDEMKRNFQARCEQEFTLHVCAGHRRAKSRAKSAHS